MKCLYAWGEDVRFKKNYFIDHVTEDYYFGRTITDSGSVIPFMRPVDFKLTKGNVVWDEDIKRWVKSS